MDWLLPYRLESDLTQTSEHQKTRPQAAESGLGETAPQRIEARGGMWARACAAMSRIFRRPPCSRS
ncbi:hypothetical protein H4CHR_05180 [Variovorax sp. PBS-H4]|nr:hypothetical protein H4CHR_05180 [Variovorax sp. PBS-H4]